VSLVGWVLKLQRDLLKREILSNVWGSQGKKIVPRTGCHRCDVGPGVGLHNIHGTNMIEIAEDKMLCDFRQTI
jgi:hypothetical protein